MTKSFSPLRVLGNKLGFLRAVSRDTLLDLGNEGINIFSMMFGNTVGLIESRHGKLYSQSNTLISLKSTLKAGDILLEKTPFRLTDNFIPGHWGHAAIWVGTEDELKRLGIWQHHLVQPHHKAIRNKHLIVEALRSGVQLSSLKSFSNVDDLAALRNQTLTDKERADIVLRTFRQLGKAYDFNFDVETTDRIVCSELIYLTHLSIKWPTDNTLGRTTISPDNIAKKAINSGPLSITALYHDGSKVTDDLPSAMRRLLEK